MRDIDLIRPEIMILQLILILCAAGLESVTGVVRVGSARVAALAAAAAAAAAVLRNAFNRP